MRYMLRIELVILLCVDNIHEINMLKVEAMLKLNSSFVLIEYLLLETIAL